MNQHAALPLHGPVHPLERPVKEQGDLLVVRVLQVVRQILELTREEILTDVPCSVHDMCDTVLPQSFAICCHLIARDIQLVGKHLRADLSEVFQLQLLDQVVWQVVVVLFVFRIPRFYQIFL